MHERITKGGFGERREVHPRDKKRKKERGESRRACDGSGRRKKSEY